MKLTTSRLLFGVATVLLFLALMGVGSSILYVKDRIDPAPSPRMRTIPDRDIEEYLDNTWRTAAMIGIGSSCPFFLSMGCFVAGGLVRRREGAEADGSSSEVEDAAP